MSIQTLSDLSLFIKFWKMYLISVSKWHLRLTRHKPVSFRLRGQHWSYGYEGHSDRWIWGKEAWDNVVRFHRVPGKIDINYEYTQKGLGSAGDCNYEIELPRGSVINKDGSITLPRVEWDDLTKNPTKSKSRKPARLKKKRKKRK